MSINEANVDTSILPLDILSLIDNQFYDVVRQLTSSNEADLLEMQQINNVNAFLLTKNPLEFIHLNSPDVEGIKKRICFELTNNSYVVKPGIQANLQYLNVIFKKKIEEYVKDMKKNVKSSKPTRTTTNIDNLDDMKTSILRSIKRWCEDNKDNFGSSELQFQENEHFVLNLITNEKAFIICKCGAKINLFKFRGKFQLSNLYRHYKGTKCSMLEKLKKEEKEKENYQLLSAIAATLSPPDARSLLLSSNQNPDKPHIPIISSTASTAQSLSNITSKRTSMETLINVAPVSKKKKK